jgi:hypothetical protein
VKTKKDQRTHEPSVIRPVSAPSDITEENPSALKRQSSDSSAPTSNETSPPIKSAEAFSFIKRGNRPQITPIAAFELPVSVPDDDVPEDSNHTSKIKNKGKIHGKVISMILFLISLLLLSRCFSRVLEEI